MLLKGKYSNINISIADYKEITVIQENNHHKDNFKSIV